MEEPKNEVMPIQPKFEIDQVVSVRRSNGELETDWVVAKFENDGESVIVSKRIHSGSGSSEKVNVLTKKIPVSELGQMQGM